MNPGGGTTPPGPGPWPGPWDHWQARRARTPRPPLRHRWDATTVLGLLAVLFGVAWLLGATGVLHVSVEAVLAIGLMLLGASLIVTARTDWSLSRRSWPVWLGAGLIAVLVATSSTFGVGGALENVSFGNMSATARSGQTIHGGFGTLTVDASQLRPGQSVQVDSVAGTIRIEPLPSGAVDVNAHVLAGQICGDGHVSNGVGAQKSFEMGKGSLPITIDVHEVFGQINVDNSSCNNSRGRP